MIGAVGSEIRSVRIELLCDRTDLVPELASYHFQEWGRLRPDETLEQRTSRLLATCGRSGIPSAFVATDGLRLLGSVLLIASDMKSRPDLTPWLAGVFVVPSARHQGVGSALVKHVTEAARATGVSQLYLYTDQSEAFYARLGWATIERCVEKGARVAIMSKALSV